MALQNETAAQWHGAEITDEPQAPQARFSGTRQERDHWAEHEERDERNDGRYDVDDRRPQSRRPRDDQWQERQWEERQWQANQQREPHWQDRYDNRRYAYRDDDHRDRRLNEPSELDQDLKAMATVWSMMRQGAVRMLGEIGRQY